MTTRAPYPYEPARDRGQSAGEGGSGPAGGAPRRSRLRTFLPLAVAAWVVLEIWLFTLVAEAAGGMTVFLLIAAGFVLGAVAIKRAGRRAWRQLSDNVQRAQAQAAGGDPDQAAGKAGEQGRRGGNAQAMLGGLLLMVPGLVSDAAGLLLLFPPTSRLLTRAARGAVGRKAAKGFEPGSLGEAYEQARTMEEQFRIHQQDGKVVQGEVVREDEPPKQ
ncbi:FxsA family membrane protein [Streptomyces sp. ODS28]|uniref:FxsA family membrane protein n=1 Tax=Streptomyces sp. ODS28 TaxID=3136688 RepID=UPI0031EC9398